MFKKLISTLKANKKYRIFFSCFVLFIYVVTAVHFSYGDGAYYYGTYLIDNLLQKGRQTTTEVISIGINDDDLNKYGSSEEIIVKLLKVLKEKPAAIGLDIAVDNINKENIIDIANRNNNIVLPIEIKFDSNPCFDDYDLCSDGINAIGAEYFDSNYESSGFTNKILDLNGVLRHEIFSIDDTYYSLNYQCYKKYCERNNIVLNDFNLSKQNSALIKYSNKIVLDYCASDILDGNVSLNDFTDKIVLIGETIPYNNITYATSNDYNNNLYAVEVDANIASCLIKNNFALNINKYIQYFLLALAIALMAIFVSINGLFLSVCCCAVYVILVLIVSNLLYGLGIVGFVFPHFINGLITCFICIGIKSIISKNKYNKQLLDVIDKYVDIKADSLIGSNEALANNDAATKKVVVLFSDIRKFTSISENAEPKKLIRMLNDTLTLMSECVEKYGGTVDKFIGDCVMAYWLDDNTAVYRASLAAKEILKKAKELSITIKNKYDVDLSIGIGIDYGDAIVGNVGSSARKNYTVIGDVVNTASRLETIAPGNSILISENVKIALGNKAVFKKISDHIFLKGKNKNCVIYELTDLSAYSIKDRETDKQDIVITKNRILSMLALIINSFVFIVQLIFVLNTVREYGVDHIVYCHIGMCIVSMVSLLLLLPYDVKNFNNGTLLSPKPHIIELVMLSGMLANIYMFLVKLIDIISLKSNLIGGVPIFVLCPDLCIFSYMVLEKFKKYNFKDVLISTIATMSCVVVDGTLSSYLGINLMYADIFNTYYNVKIVTILLIVDLLITLFLIKLDERVNLQNKLINVKFDFLYRLDNFVSNDNLYKIVMTKNNVIYLNIILDLIIGLLSIRATINGYLAGGVSLYSNPSLIGIVILICCIFSISNNIYRLFNNNKYLNDRFYKYNSLMKTLGCQINFLSILLLAISGEGISVFFSGKWNADWTVYILCPVLTFCIWINEKNSYNSVIKSLMTSLPYIVILFLSRAAVNSSMISRDYSFEISNFYSLKSMIIIVFGEMILSLMLAFIARISTRLIEINRSSKKRLELYVCGNRIGKKTIKNSVYGKDGECYVIRDGDYALIINAGSGLINASEKLIGCKDVDMLLTSNELDFTSGFNLTKNICPEAKIRVISPFNIEQLAAKPIWQHDAFKYDYEVVKANKRCRLNNLYSFYFINNGYNNYLLRIYGLLNICYTGKIDTVPTCLLKHFDDCDLIIYDSISDISQACYLTIKSNSLYILFSGFDSAISDKQLKAKEKLMKKTIVEGDFTIVGKAYVINN